MEVGDLRVDRELQIRVQRHVQSNSLIATSQVGCELDQGCDPDCLQRGFAFMPCGLALQGDAEDLPFATDSFDRYVSAGSIEYWPEPQRGIKVGQIFLSSHAQWKAHTEQHKRQGLQGFSMTSTSTAVARDVDNGADCCKQVPKSHGFQQYMCLHVVLTGGVPCDQGGRCRMHDWPSSPNLLALKVSQESHVTTAWLLVVAAQTGCMPKSCLLYFHPISVVVHACILYLTPQVLCRCVDAVPH
jgi:hypothetical protein